MREDINWLNYSLPDGETMTQHYKMLSKEIYYSIVGKGLEVKLEIGEPELDLADARKLGKRLQKVALRAANNHQWGLVNSVNPITVFDDDIVIWSLKYWGLIRVNKKSKVFLVDIPPKKPLPMCVVWALGSTLCDLAMFAAGDTDET
jgi:hypothetical protein